MKKLIFLVGVVTGASIAYFGMKWYASEYDKASESIEVDSEVSDISNES